MEGDAAVTPPPLHHPSLPTSIFPARTNRTTGLDLNPNRLRKIHPSLASPLTVRNDRRTPT